MERYEETVQNAIKDVELTTDMVLDHMIENDRQIYDMTELDRVEFEWVLTRFEKKLSKIPPILHVLIPTRVKSIRDIISR